MDLDNYKFFTTLSGIRIYGKSVYEGVVEIVNPVNPDLGGLTENNVIVTPFTTPEMVPVLKVVAGVVTEQGGRLSHAAIVARELGVNCLTGVNYLINNVRTGDYVSVRNRIHAGVWIPRIESRVFSNQSYHPDSTVINSSNWKRYINNSFENVDFERKIEILGEIRKMGLPCVEDLVISPGEFFSKLDDVNDFIKKVGNAFVRVKPVREGESRYYYDKIRGLDDLYSFAEEKRFDLNNRKFQLVEKRDPDTLFILSSKEGVYMEFAGGSGAGKKLGQGVGSPDFVFYYNKDSIPGGEPERSIIRSALNHLRASDNLEGIIEGYFECDVFKPADVRFRTYYSKNHPIYLSHLQVLNLS